MATVKSRVQVREDRIQALREEIERVTGKTPEQLYEEREKRIRDAVELRQPDRVPVTLGEGVYAARHGGLTVSAMYYDIAAYREAIRQTVLDFEPDLCGGGVAATSGIALELLETKHQRWPGGTLPDDIPYQFVEGEYMKAEEYDIFLNDPSDFALRYYYPRIYGSLAPLSKLPPFRNLGFTAMAHLFATAEFKQLADTLYKVGQEQQKARETAAGAEDEMNRLGFPTQQLGGGVGGAPYDLLADQLRGMRGAMMDMYRCPDKLLAACDKILQWRLAAATPADPKKRANPKILGRPLHKGAEGFMSVKQFETFYWPGLKASVIRDTELGYVPRLGWQGKCDSRLEYFLELPRGKVICWFQDTDMARAKEVLGGHICISGNVPGSLLQLGTPEQVDEYCKKLIKTCGKGGGFILAAGGGIDEAKPQNIKAMMDSVKKYSP